MKLSIITINLNNALGLQKTIESVVNQTSDTYEHIIIDGGSADDSVKVIERYLQDTNYAKHVSYWCSEKDKGIYDAMNKGIEKASGDYCFFLNSGDAFCDTNVISRINGYSFNEDVVCFNVFLLNKGEKTLLHSPKVVNEQFFIRNFMFHQSALIKTELQKRKKYRTDFKIISDNAFFIDALLVDNGTYRYIDDVLCDYDAEFGISSTNTELVEKERMIVLSEYLSNRIKKNNELTYLYYDYEYGYYGLVKKFRKLLNWISSKTLRKNHQYLRKYEDML